MAGRRLVFATGFVPLTLFVTDLAVQIDRRRRGRRLRVAPTEA